MKYKARARRRRVAATCAGVSALTVLGGTAYASEGGGRYHKDPGDATFDNSGDAKAKIDQKSYVKTAQLALSNTGANESIAVVGGVNLGKQKCYTDLDGGNIYKSDNENIAGNEGGNCINDGKQRNSGVARAPITTGDADATNNATTRVRQANSGDASVGHTANGNTIESEDGDAYFDNSGNAYLKVSQKASVKTYQIAGANSGGNVAVAAVIGINAGKQSGSTNVSGGDIKYSDDHNTAGNTGGNATNTASQKNAGTAEAPITTGNATATNNSTTNVRQSNSGSASSANTATGNTVEADD